MEPSKFNISSFISGALNAFKFVADNGVQCSENFIPDFEKDAAPFFRQVENYAHLDHLSPWLPFCPLLSSPVKTPRKTEDTSLNPGSAPKRDLSPTFRVCIYAAGCLLDGEEKNIRKATELLRPYFPKRVKSIDEGRILCVFLQWFYLFVMIEAAANPGSWDALRALQPQKFWNSLGRHFREEIEQRRLYPWEDIYNEKLWRYAMKNSIEFSFAPYFLQMLSAFESEKRGSPCPMKIFGALVKTNLEVSGPIGFPNLSAFQEFASKETRERCRGSRTPTQKKKEILRDGHATYFTAVSWSILTWVGQSFPSEKETTRSYLLSFLISKSPLWIFSHLPQSIKDGCSLPRYRKPRTKNLPLFTARLHELKDYLLYSGREAEFKAILCYFGVEPPLPPREEEEGRVKPYDWTHATQFLNLVRAMAYDHRKNKSSERSQSAQHMKNHGCSSASDPGVF